MIKMWWYKNDGVYNFGDELGPYLVRKLSGEEVRFKEISKWPFNRTLITIGSILAASTRNCNVWGSGVIDKFHNIGGGNFFAVRGPITQQRVRECGHKAPDVLGDPALLLPWVYKPRIDPKYKLGIIPHHVDYGDIRNKVNDPEILIIDLTEPIEIVVTNILSCKMILSTSLHGLIVPHAYGIPALWFRHSDKLVGDNSKFKDYYLSVGLIGASIIDFDINKLSDVKVEKLFYENSENSLPNINLDEMRQSLVGAAPFKIMRDYLEYAKKATNE